MAGQVNPKYNKPSSTNDSNENVQDVGMGEDLVKVDDKNKNSQMTNGIINGNYNDTDLSGLDLYPYLTYEEKDETNSAKPLFEITVNDTINIQDSPVAGAPTSSCNGGVIKPGDSYVVTGVVLDADSKEWLRIEVNGQTVFVSAEGLTQDKIKFKDSKDKEKYDYIKVSKGWSDIKDTINRQNIDIMNAVNGVSSEASLISAFGETSYTVGNTEYTLVSGSIMDTSHTYLNYRDYMWAMNRVMGTPPQWSIYADPGVNYYNTQIIGRRYSQVILSNPTIISICPGRLAFTKGVVDNLLNINWNDASKESIVSALSTNGVDMLWKFEEMWDINYGGYLSYVNALCRYAVMCLSTEEDRHIVSDGSNDDENIPLSEREVPLAFRGGTAETATDPIFSQLGEATGYDSSKYAYIDLSGLLGSTVAPGSYDDANEKQGTTLWANIQYNIDNSIDKVKNYFSGLFNTVAKASKNAFKNHFVHFAVSGQANVRESFSTETRSSSLENLVGSGVSDVIKDISFIVGGGFAEEADVMGDINQLKDAVQKNYPGLFNILGDALDILKGGTVAWPQMVGNVSWGREYTFNVKFISPYGDTESRFLNTLMPYICLMCLWLPKQMETTIDMYTWPFVVQAYAQGIFACPAGVLTNIEVSHGGGEETGWTGDGAQTEIDVSFSITPLHQKLSMSNPNYFFLKNVAMQNYMGTVCGIDLTMPQAKLISETADRLWDAWIAEHPGRKEAAISSRVHDDTFWKMAGLVLTGFNPT